MNEFTGCYLKRVKTRFNAFLLADTEFIRWPPWTRWPGSLLLTILLAGCATRLDVDQAHHSEPAGEIWGQQTVGQTFVAEKDGLNRIDVFLATYARENAGPIIFHLRESPTATQDLATIRFDAADVQDNAYRSFTFPPLHDSQQRPYYFFLEAPAAEPGNAITVWASPTDTYSHGQAYLAGQPQPGDLAFRTYADYSLAEIGRDLWRGLRRNAGITFLAILLFAVPGVAVLSVFYYFQSNWELAVLAAGLSVALAPLLVLFTSQAGLSLSRGPVITLLIVFAAVAVLPTLRQQLHLRISTSPHPSTPVAQPSSHPAIQPSSHPAIQPSHTPTLLLSIIVLISLTTRLLLVQDLPAPMWGDSYHHTLIAQLLVDHGGLFRSWEPYAPLQSFTYHFGFHSNVALFHWLTGIPIVESVIVVGQILNALAPLMIYPLVRRLGGTAWAGLIAVLIASLLSPMPAGYVNWGRYTQLTGMVVLPVAATLTIDAISAEGWVWRRLVLAGVAVAGLALSHYLVTLLFVPLVLACLVWQSGSHIRQPHAWSQRNRVFARKRHLASSDQVSSPPYIPFQGKTRFLASEIARPWLRAGAVGVIAGLLITPWILNLRTGYLPAVLAGRFGRGGGTAYFQTTYNAVGDLFAYVPPWLMALAVAGALWGCWQRRPLAIVTSIWTALLVLTANPNLIGLPGTGVVNNFTLLIASYLPLSMLAGAGVGELIERVIHVRDGIGARRRTTKVVTTDARRGIVVILIIAAALAGARLRLMDLDYRYRLVTPADMEAMQWIRDNTPEDAKFLVNSLTAFGGYTVVGDDAGWWIPYFTGRRTTVPPATYGMETARDPDFPTQVEAFYRAITAHRLDSPETVEALHANDITYIYIGAAGGELLDPTRLRRSSFYRLAYDRDGAMVFEVAW